CFSKPRCLPSAARPRTRTKARARSSRSGRRSSKESSQWPVVSGQQTEARSWKSHLTTDYWELMTMIRSIVFPRVLGRSPDDLQPALELFRALGFAPGNEWHEGGNHGVEMQAPSGGIEFIAAPDAPSVDAMVELSDADGAWEIVKKFSPTLSANAADKSGAPAPGITIRKEI